MVTVGVPFSPGLELGGGSILFACSYLLGFHAGAPSLAYHLFIPQPQAGSK